MFLSVFGRALLAKSCLLSHIWFPASVTLFDETRLTSLFKSICAFVHMRSPGFKFISYANSRLSCSDGGLGLLDPALEVRAIHACHVARLLTLSTDPSPWRLLLWRALLSVYTPARPANFLTHHWSANAFSKRTLASDLLIAWSMLHPQNVPQHAPLSWILHRGEWIQAALPPIPAAAGIIVCGDIPLATLSVKSTYRFLLAQDIMRVQPRPLRPLSDLPAVLWPERWLWIAKSPLPIKVRQTVWRRWHNKLYLGPEEPSIDALADDDPDQHFDPKCPFDNVHIDSPAHFVHQCPAVARAAQLYLAQCWRLWARSRPLWILGFWTSGRRTLAGWLPSHASCMLSMLAVCTALTQSLLHCQTLITCSMCCISIASLSVPRCMQPLESSPPLHTAWRNLAGQPVGSPLIREL